MNQYERNWVSAEEIAAAREISAYDYISIILPQDLYPVGRGEYRSKSYSSLTLNRDDGVFHYWKEDKAGNNAIDFVMRIEHLRFQDAVRRINDICGGVILLPTVKSSIEATPEIEKPFSLPHKDKNTDVVHAYLTKRGISPKVLRFCYEHGILYQNTRGKYRNCVFVGYDISGVAKAAWLRGCQVKWRRDFPGSQKKCGFIIPAENPDCDTVEIFEAPIDALSAATLRQYSHKSPWRSVHYLASGGTNLKAIDYFLENHSHIKKIRLGLDNDPAGRSFTARLIKEMSQRGYSVEDIHPRAGKDYNDYLLYCRGSMNQER